MRKVHLCEKCAAKHNAGQMPIIKFAEMITKKLFGEKLGKEILSGAVQAFAEDEFKGGKKCPQCGTSLGELEKHERFGCAQCYFVFADELNAVLPKIQQVKAPGAADESEKNSGDAPKKATRNAGDEELSEAELEKILQSAVAQENYALAAQTRDRIQKLKRRAARKKKSAKATGSVPEATEPVPAKRRKSASAETKSGNKKGKKQ